MYINKMENINFHIVVKPYVDKVLVFTKNEYVCEMICANPLTDEPEENLIYNGSIPKSFSNQTLLVQLLGNGGSTEYKFADLFSKPAESIDNIIIVNTPKEILYVSIKVPTILRKLFNFPEYWFLADAEKCKIRLIRPEADTREKLAHGIDPAGKQFVKLVKFEIPETYKQRPTELHKIMKDCYFTLFCYASFKHLELILK